MNLFIRLFYFMELLEIVHSDTGLPTGNVLTRPEAIANRAWCRSTNIFILDRRGHVLCHKRSEQKERLPGVWTTHVGGHVGAGETYETNALKEVEEEAGITIAPHQLITWRTHRVEHSNTAARVHLWMRDYVVLYDAPVEAFTPQPGEVDEFAWKSLDEILHHSTHESDKWMSGIQHFATEYYCARAALIAAHTTGTIQIPDELHTWHTNHLALAS